MKITDIIAESKQPKDAPKPRNFVAKNAINTGAGQHKDKKRAEKQGDVKHKKQAVPMDEQGVAEGYRDRRDAYQRDYDSSVSGMDGGSKRDFKRRELEHELGHETNNYAVAINGKAWKVFATHSHAEAVARKIQMKDPSKKVSVHETGAAVTESATAGATSAGNVAVGAVYKNKPAKQAKNKDGTAKNALDMKANLMTGGSIKR
jgi:hypothetical protein